MSTFEVLLGVAPSTGRQTVAFVILARAVIPGIADLARRHGAQAVKKLTSGDELAQAVTKAIAMIGPTHKECQESH